MKYLGVAGLIVLYLIYKVVEKDINDRAEVILSEMED
jgi:hypothetical protein